MAASKTVDAPLHELLQIMLKDLTPIISRIKNDGMMDRDYIKGEKDVVRKYGAGELYTIDSFRAATKLCEMPKRLSCSIALMGRKPAGNLLTRLDMPRTEYIEHHYSHFVFTMASVKEAAMETVNIVLNLGLPSRKLSERLVKSPKVIEYSLIPDVEEIRKMASSYNRKKNDLFHRGEVPKIDGMGMTNFIDRANHLSKDDKIPRVNELIKLRMQPILKDLQEDAKQAEALISDLCTKLIPAYQSWMKEPPDRRSPEQATTYTMRE